LIFFALWVLGSTAWHAFRGTLPRAEVMRVVGFAALIANVGVALILYRFRAGDANVRSVWICSRNDALAISRGCLRR
jgi:Co/Zn/Cd efflux system component